MLVCQSKNTFIRTHDDFAYIVNQLTNAELIVNETGSDFLKEISRVPQDIYTIVNRLVRLYDNSVDSSVIANEFECFCRELFEEGYLLLGDTEEEIWSKDVDFSYELFNFNSEASNYGIANEQKEKDTIEFWLSQARSGIYQLNDIQLELTSSCNERCIHCYIPNETKNVGREMNFKDFCYVIDQFVEMGGVHVGLSGGECLTHKRILNIIDYCRQKDLIITILSNLIALRDEQIPFLKRANISHIQTSLYSMDATIHDKITTVKGSWKKTKTAIEKLIAANVPVQISCPLMTANKDSFVDVLKYATSLHTIATTDYTLIAESNQETMNLANRLSISDVEKAMRSVLEYKMRTGELLHNSLLPDASTQLDDTIIRPVCNAAINSLCVLASGDVCVCPGWNGLLCGNIHKQSLKDIWENSEQINRVRNVSQKDFPQCMECEARDYCNNCLERNFNEGNGDMLKINEHFCKVAFLNKRIGEEYQDKIQN